MYIFIYVIALRDSFLEMVGEMIWDRSGIFIHYTSNFKLDLRKFATYSVTGIIYNPRSDYHLSRMGWSDPPQWQKMED